MNNYRIWRLQHNNLYVIGSTGKWWPTRDIIKARSPKDARNKMVRRFKRAGFHHMSLVAAPLGHDPNEI